MVHHHPKCSLRTLNSFNIHIHKMKSSSLLSLAAVLGTSLASHVDVIRYGQPLVPGGRLPEPHATSDGAAIVQSFANLDRDTTWKLVKKTHFEGNTGEPEGMVRLTDDRYFVAAGRWTVPTVYYPHPINGTDRTAGAGFAHILVYDGQGGLVANATLTKPGDIEYHIGGIDYDGRYLWATLSQYRPNSTATIVKIDPRTLQDKALFRTDDHNGGIVHDTVVDDLVTLNWGSRNATRWSLDDYPRGFTPLPGFTPPLASLTNPTSFIDYQDCKFLGHQELPGPMSAEFGAGAVRPVMFCGGVAEIGTFYLGGIALVDLETMLPLWELPVSMTSDLGASVTQNPIDITVIDDKLRIYCLPDEFNSTLYVYEAQ